jgi:hypothetical protein
LRSGGVPLIIELGNSFNLLVIELKPSMGLSFSWDLKSFEGILDIKDLLSAGSAASIGWR